MPAVGVEQFWRSATLRLSFRARLELEAWKAIPAMPPMMSATRRPVTAKVVGKGAS